MVKYKLNNETNMIKYTSPFEPLPYTAKASSYLNLITNEIQLEK
jgi:hypothetical protein